MNRRFFIVTILGSIASMLGLHASVPKPSARAQVESLPVTGYRHTILPPPQGKMPLDRSAWRQYVSIDPTDRNHAISWWARSEPPKGDSAWLF